MSQEYLISQAMTDYFGLESFLFQYDCFNQINLINILARHFIMEYLNDAVQQLLESKNSNSKIGVMEFFLE